jgi:hypothetical protein
MNKIDNFSRNRSVLAINKKTGKKFYHSDPYKLMKQLSEKHHGQGAEFNLVILNPNIRFLMKLANVHAPITLWRK